MMIAAYLRLYLKNRWKKVLVQQWVKRLKWKKPLDWETKKKEIETFKALYIKNTKGYSQPRKEEGMVQTDMVLVLFSQCIEDKRGQCF